MGKAKKLKTANAADLAEYVLRGCATCEIWRPETGTADAWRVWVARNTVEWLSEDGTPTRIDKGAHYALCGDCTGLLAAGKTRDVAQRMPALARVLSTLGELPGPLVAGYRDHLGWVLRLAQAAQPVTYDAWRAERGR